MKNKKILFIDMDGVLCDFDGAIEKFYPNIESIEDYDLRSAEVDKICEANTNMFHTLKPVKGALNAVMLLSGHYEIYFLSTPMWNVPQSFTDKRLWIRDHFGPWANKRLILTHRKDLNIGAYLIDDRLKNGAGEFTGVHIHFGSEDFPDWDAVLKHLLPHYHDSLSSNKDLASSTKYES